MLSSLKRQRSGRVFHWLLIGLGVLVAGAVGVFGAKRAGFLEWDRYHSDSELLVKLERADLATAAPSEDKPADWPQWRGLHRDGFSTETGLLTAWPKDGPPVLWRADTGAGFSSMAVADGRVYTIFQDGPNEAVLCWDADTGKELWRFGYPCKYDNSFGSGPRSTPTVDGDRVYTVGATGLFHCLDAATGKEVWPEKHNLLTEFGAPTSSWGVALSPLVEGDLVFTNPGGPGGNSIAAFDKMTGKLAWKALDDPVAYSSPVAATIAGTRQILFFTNKGLVSVSPKDGTVYWRHAWDTNYGCNIATPIVVGNYVFISSDYGKGCVLLEITSNGGTLQARPVYENNRMRNHFSTSVFFKDHLYGFDDANLACMDFRTGTIRWKQRGFDKGSLLIADGHLIVLGEKGKLALAEATPEGYREQASFQAFHDQCWSMPVLASGKLYVRDQQQILCLDLRKR